MHSLDWPDYAAQHDNWQEAAHGHVCSGAFIFTGARDDETCREAEDGDLVTVGKVT